MPSLTKKNAFTQASNKEHFSVTRTLEHQFKELKKNKIPPCSIVNAHAIAKHHIHLFTKTQSTTSFKIVIATHAKQKQHTNLIRFYEKSMAHIKSKVLDHNDTYCIGLAYFYEGVYDKAIELFERTLSLFPEHDGAKIFLSKIYASASDKTYHHGHKAVSYAQICVHKR